MSRVTPQKFIPPFLPQAFSSLQIYQFDHLEETNSDHRLLLREIMADQIHAEGFEKPEHFLDLSRRPQHSELSVSISHTFHKSAFAWVAKPLTVGIDIELINRIQLPIIERVCSEKEMSSSPTPQFLWSAKESVFKAIDPQATVLSQIEIYNWHPVDENTYTFQARLIATGESLDGLGCICIDLKHYLSFFVLQHQL
jgi:phosphopantetheinyl transferase (holo-ACP synthase)